MTEILGDSWSGSVLEEGPTKKCSAAGRTRLYFSIPRTLDYRAHAAETTPFSASPLADSVRGPWPASRSPASTSRSTPSPRQLDDDRRRRRLRRRRRHRAAADRRHADVQLPRRDDRQISLPRPVQRARRPADHRPTRAARRPARPAAPGLSARPCRRAARHPRHAQPVGCDGDCRHRRRHPQLRRPRVGQAGRNRRAWRFLLSERLPATRSTHSTRSPSRSQHSEVTAPASPSQVPFPEVAPSWTPCLPRQGHRCAARCARP